MKERFKMFRRKGGMFYARDTATMSKESLGTKDREQASRLVRCDELGQQLLDASGVNIVLTP